MSSDPSIGSSSGARPPVWPDQDRSRLGSASKLLLVDDDPIALRVMASLLRGQGHTVDVANNGREALELLAKTTYPLIVTDWMMPEIDGIELVRRIRGAQGLAYTYVIMLTARGDDHADANHALEAGVDDLLAKPVHRDDLIARLRVAERIIALQGQLMQRNSELTHANDRMKRDLASAAQVQRGLLPQVAPKAAGWTTAWRSEACDELGGDTLNIFQLDENHLAAYVLDVSGHGVGSALLAVQANRLLQPVMGLGSMLKAPTSNPPFYRLVQPKDLMMNLANKFPPQWDAPQFFTMIYAQVNIRSGDIIFASGGHPPPLIAGGGQAARAIELESSAIGMLDAADCEFTEARMTLQPGERVLLYSDGVTETMKPDGDIYGQDRLLACWNQSAGLPLSEALDAIVADITAYRGDEPVGDDVTMLAFERQP